MSETYDVGTIFFEFLPDIQRKRVIVYYTANHSGCDGVKAVSCLTEGGSARSSLINALTGTARFDNSATKYAEELLTLAKMLEF